MNNENYKCINKTEECGKCVAKNLCVKYETKNGDNPFTLNRKTVEEIMDENRYIGR